MAKIDFSKVEGSFDDERRKKQQEELLKEVDRLTGKEETLNPEIEKEKKRQIERKILKQALLHDLKSFDEALFSRITELKKEELKKILDKGVDLTEEDYLLLGKMKQTLDEYKKNHPEWNDRLVEEERKKHVNRRLNVKDKWLPLK